jgi:hypothetical protein
MASVTYSDGRTPTLLGDHVEFRIPLFFWRGWQPGRVHYVPGISPSSPSLEFGGLTWVSIHDRRGAPTGFVVDPDTHQLDAKVRFVRRTDDALCSTPEGYEFPEE